MSISDDVLGYWAAIGSDGWWKKDASVDQHIVAHFGSLHDQACAGQLDAHAKSPDGALALIIVLDQFSRNMFRDSPRAFAQDEQALSISKSAVAAGLDQSCRQDLRVFFYLPFEHSECIRDQEISLKLQHSIRDSEEAMKAAVEHHEIIKRFGRFPHRNRVLGRHTTPAEQAYLDGGGFKG